jgi:SAM-dependent methyltransferase
MNKLGPVDRPAHDWYRFVLSYPPHLVRHYLDRFGLGEGSCVLDPFCGTGTTLVEAKKQGVASVGIEANPMAAFASRVKTTWDVDPAGLIAHAQLVAAEAERRIEIEGSAAPLRALPEECRKLILSNSISARPLHKVLVLLEVLDQQREDRFYDHERLAHRCFNHGSPPCRAWPTILPACAIEQVFRRQCIMPTPAICRACWSRSRSME